MKLLAIAALAALLAVPTAQAEGVQIGRLSCEVDGGIGLILGSSKDVSCAFYREGHSTETYSGEINKLGLDIGVTDSTHIEWLVFAATTDYSTGALAGTYVGVSGEATFGVGLGGNVLIGGSNKSIALQPFSVQAQTGLSLAVGLAGLTLR